MFRTHGPVSRPMRPSLLTCFRQFHFPQSPGFRFPDFSVSTFLVRSASFPPAGGPASFLLCGFAFPFPFFSCHGACCCYLLTLKTTSSEAQQGEVYNALQFSSSTFLNFFRYFFIVRTAWCEQYLSQGKRYHLKQQFNIVIKTASHV